MSYLTTQFTIAGEPVELPEVASGTAVKNAAKRFENAFGLPGEAAFAMAAATVDPADVRGQIDAKSPFDHLQRIQTPGGQFLLAQQTHVWTSMISGDGGNGRSRYAIQTKTTDGIRPRPWPIGRHRAPAIVDYHSRSLTDMATAVRLSAEEIRSPDLVTQIARNPRGVWNPPVVVLARAYVKRQDGSLDERWFLHTVEGSTRVEACHDLTGVDPAAPLEHSDESSLAYLRGSHKELLERFETTPTSRRTLGAARAVIMPALIVVGAVGAENDTPIESGFPTIINDYVESVHVQPRPFTEAAQSNVIGERFILTLENKERMTTKDAEAVLGRDLDVGGRPSVRAAKLVHAVCDDANDDLLRDFLITEPGAKLTKIKRAKLIGPLVVRQFNSPADSAERALMRAFTPDRLMDEWTISGADAETLRQTCLAHLDAGLIDTDTMAELMARGGPALCAAGLLLSDQGSTVKGNTDLRGSVDKVVERLAQIAGGVNVLADAVAWADGERREKPRQFDPAGHPKVVNGDGLHFSTAWDAGNMGIRALAFCEDGEIPRDNAGPKSYDAPVELSPEAKYEADEKKLIRYLNDAQMTLGDLFAARDEQGRKLIAKIGLRREEVYRSLPDQLGKLYARYGNEDDVFGSFDEDELPEGDVSNSTVEDDD